MTLPWGGPDDFGRANLSIWNASIGVEVGDGGRVAEIADKVSWQSVFTFRQGGFWMDLDRGLIAEKTQSERFQELLEAEE